MSDFHIETLETIRQLHARFPRTPFLTLGQTVLWDEPTKAVFCRILETAAPEATMVAAVHDTDYFAKLPQLESQSSDTADGSPFVMLPHNDGDTRGLWSAAGELSSLFGGETVPARQQLTENGVHFDRVARDYPGGARELLNRETEAWGWRALVHTRPHPLIAADVKLGDIAPALRQQIEWGFNESLQILGAENTEATTRIRDWIDEFIEANTNGTLSDLYRWLTPKLWGLVRGGCTCHLTTGTSMELFRFNRATCQLPRFRFVDLFLQRETRDIARRCYDDAVRGSGIYTLSQFGEGALPFDVVIPGRGRGTLRLHQGSVYIDLEQPLTLCNGCDCDSVEALADLLENQFGPDVVLVGKAVALISMLSAEYIFVFHEKASSYTSRTQKMNDCLRAAGVKLELHPLLRLKYATWNALAGVPTPLTLPSHLRAAFGQEQLTASDFAARWEHVCTEQDQLREQLRNCPSTRELLGVLTSRNEARWGTLREEYQGAHDTVLAVRERTKVLEEEAKGLKVQADEARLAAVATERVKGDDFRSRVQPLRERLFNLKEAAAARLIPLDENGKPRRLSKEERAAQTELEARETAEIAELRESIARLQRERTATFDEQIQRDRQCAREARGAARELVRERVELERSEETRAARAAVARIEYEVELERLRLVRDAIVVSDGLRYTNYRPTAWWLPLVSPDGQWFNGIAASTQARVEEL